MFFRNFKKRYVESLLLNENVWKSMEIIENHRSETIGGIAGGPDPETSPIWGWSPRQEIIENHRSETIGGITGGPIRNPARSGAGAAK